MISLTMSLLMTVQAVPAGASPLMCPQRWGEAGEALVKTEGAAKAIYIAVADGFSVRPDKERLPEVKAIDHGAYWSVFRYRPTEYLPNGVVRVTHGGGQLSMHIAKCDGAISDVWLSK